MAWGQELYIQMKKKRKKKGKVLVVIASAQWTSEKLWLSKDLARTQQDCPENRNDLFQLFTFYLQLKHFFIISFSGKEKEGPGPGPSRPWATRPSTKLTTSTPLRPTCLGLRPKTPSVTRTPAGRVTPRWRIGNVSRIKYKKRVCNILHFLDAITTK